MPPPAPKAATGPVGEAGFGAQPSCLRALGSFPGISLSLGPESAVVGLEVRIVVEPDPSSFILCGFGQSLCALLICKVELQTPVTQAALKSKGERGRKSVWEALRDCREFCRQLSDFSNVVPDSPEVSI